MFRRPGRDVRAGARCGADRRAVLAANMETAVNICWDAAPLAGERVLVVGAGVVGLLTASLLARIPGCA